MGDRTAFVQRVYTDNKRSMFNYSSEVENRITIDLDRFDVDADEITFTGDDFPYLKVAVLDTYLDSME